MNQTTNSTALLVMDMQTTMIGSLPDAAELISNTQKAIAAARAGNVPVIYVIVGFRPGAPELNPHGKGAASAGGRALWTEDFCRTFIEIHPELAPQTGDIVVTKRRVSAFTGSDLEVVLRAQQIRHIVLAGYATSGVVLSTVREASDKDFGITVLADCCTDKDLETHDFLTARIFPRQAEVVNVSDWQSMPQTKAD